ncbi:phage distal tail protein [Streptomyces syringium]|uniref:phage distal tail protein n=1 Tax=Streptomyces syringium TaxID=76729 RepID=UPI0033AFDFB0
MPAGDLITRDGQLEWRGALLGAGTPYRMTRLEGWLDLGETRGANPDRPGRHGLLQGSLLLGRRTVTLSYLVSGVPRERFGQVVEDLRTLTAPGERPVEEPLVIRLDGRSWLANVRCVRRTVGVEKLYAVGHTTGAVQWEATDPRLYSPTEHRAATSLPAPPTDGLRFPLFFPLAFGAGKAGGRLIAVNRGGAATWPVWEIDGPVTGPMVTERDTGQRLVCHPDFTVARDQTLVIDTDARTVLLNGVNHNDVLLTRQWFPFPVGTPARVDFTATSYDPAARLTARWRDATL